MGSSCGDDGSTLLRLNDRDQGFDDAYRYCDEFWCDVRN